MKQTITFFVELYSELCFNVFCVYIIRKAHSHTSKATIENSETTNRKTPLVKITFLRKKEAAASGAEKIL